jgi:hypothetical protein
MSEHRLTKYEKKLIGLGQRLEGGKPHPLLLMQAMIIIVEALVNVIVHVRTTEDIKDKLRLL